MDWLTNYQNASMREKKKKLKKFSTTVGKTGFKKKIPKKQKRVTARDIKTSPGLQGWARRHLARRDTLAGARGTDKMCKQ